MGAEQFCNVVLARSAGEAFAKAVKDALYDYGHAGYTGTIAEKSSYLYIGQLPARWTLDKYETQLGRATEWLITYQEWDPKRNKLVTPAPSWREWKYNEEGRSVVVKHRTDPRPDKLKPFLSEKIVKEYDDKWGSAIVMRANKQQERQIKKQYHVSGTRARVYQLMGYASS